MIVPKVFGSTPLTPIEVNGEVRMHKPNAMIWKSEDADGELFAKSLYDKRKNGKYFNFEEILKICGYEKIENKQINFIGDKLIQPEMISPGPDVFPCGTTYIAESSIKYKAEDKDKYLYGENNSNYKDGIWEFVQYPKLCGWKKTELNIVYNAIRYFNKHLPESIDRFIPVNFQKYNLLYLSNCISNELERALIDIFPYMNSDYNSTYVLSQLENFIQKNFNKKNDAYQLVRVSFQKSILFVSPKWMKQDLLNSY